MAIYSKQHTTFHRAIMFQHLLTPIAIDWVQLANEFSDRARNPRQYRTLYIFGFRVATWRAD